MIHYFKNIIIKLIIRFQGGEKSSKLLRQLKSKQKVNVGLYTYGSCFSDGFNVGGEVKVGRYCSFGPNVRYFGANHPLDHAVMSPYFYNHHFSGFNVRDVDRHSLYIGNDVWIGNNVTIVSTCKRIGNGAVIGAGAVVNCDIPPYAIAVGVPARVIRFRFKDEVIAKIEASKWWELSPAELMKYYSLIDNPIQWAEKIIEERTKK